MTMDSAVTAMCNIIKAFKIMVMPVKVMVKSIMAMVNTMEVW